jgi:hypothetical protein
VTYTTKVDRPKKDGLEYSQEYIIHFFVDYYTPHDVLLCIVYLSAPCFSVHFDSNSSNEHGPD